MSAEPRRNREDILKRRDLLPGLASTFMRWPKVVKTLKKMASVKMSDRESMGSVLEENALKYPDKTAVLYLDERLTHREFNEAINRFANYFLSRGMKKGDRAVLFLDNRPEMLILIGAMSKIGAISSLLNANQRGKVLLHSVNITRGNVFIVGEEMLDAFEEIRQELDLGEDDEVYFLPDGTEPPTPDGYLDLQDLTKDSSTKNPPTTGEITLDDPFAYVFTSGTTGMPKASVQIHFRWVGANNWFGRLNMNLTPDDVMYISLPLFHTNGLNVAWGAAAANGSAVAIRRKFSASNFWKDARKFNATAFIYIGEICRYLMNQPPADDDGNNPIRKIVGNGLRPEIWKDLKKRFAIPYVYELYGAAEGMMIFTNYFNIDNTVGLCLTPFAIVKYDIDEDMPIRNENGFMQKVKPGEAGLMLGHITDRSPFAGYTDKESTEKKVFRDVFEKGDAWFNTGDMMRDIGFMHSQFVDRLGDTFRWKGENVSTTEVEEVLNSMDEIEGSTVYGVKIPGTDGRAGMAAIIPESKKDDLDKKKLAETLRGALPSYALPLFIRIKTEFDTTATHKIKKSVLKEEGFDPEKISNPLYALLSGESDYTALTGKTYSDIIDGKYKF